jgi:DNA-binding CsgD family transcriptional regulator/tetratricopeptide (TPR) repeat protein
VAGESALREVDTLDFLCHEEETIYWTDEDTEPGAQLARGSGRVALADPDGTAAILVGRDREIVALGALMRDCRQGKGIVAVIRGPIASGKTALLQAFAKRVAATGAIFLDAAASRAERGLPLGILHQLFRSNLLPASTSQQIADLIQDRALIGMPPEREPETVGPVMARVCEGLLNILVELTERHPVVIAVDDMQYADVASLQCLSYLARRASTSRILTVLTECAQTLPADRLLHADLLRQGNCHAILLAPLPPSEVARLLSEHLDSGAAERLASSCHAMTGGSPLLVKALGEDARASGNEAELVPLNSFRSAVVTCLHRYEPGMVELAQAAAVLGRNTTPGLLAELLGISAESVRHGINSLSASGLLESGSFRHEAARQAVLEHMTADERAAMHGRAARTLYKAGAAPAILARHVVDAHGVGARWAIPVLNEAAQCAVADGDASRAIAYLRRAQSECVDDRQRAVIRFALTCAEWPVNPEGAARHLSDLVADAREGRLDNESLGNLAYYLLWVGDTDNAAEILSTLDIAHEDAKAQKAGFRAHNMRSPLEFIYPGLAKRARNAIQNVNPSSQGAARPRPESPGAVDTDSDAVLVVAERILQEGGASDPTLASVTTALMALICEDMLDRAEFWCNSLMQGSEASRGSVFWQAVLTGFRAIVETRRGNLQAAEDHARTALALLPRKAWGIAIGVPLSSLLLTTIAARKHADAAACLRVPVPEAMYETPYGLLYLYARGEYYLATGSPQTALADFTDCGNRMIRWGLDQPGLVPWRAKAAEAYLVIGNDHQARQLSREQLAQAGSRSSRTRGISLRAFALTMHPSKRTALLRESAEVLRDSGARLELAYTFNELSNAHLALGEHSRAHWAARQARNLAERCGAQALKATFGKTDRGEPEPGSEADASPLACLSDAEQRVAMLAACGYTNIQISHKLYITVSTVEQHLTRVYRKLGVTGRAELPIDT